MTLAERPLYLSIFYGISMNLVLRDGQNGPVPLMSIRTDKNLVHEVRFLISLLHNTELYLGRNTLLQIVQP
jgi:hypothetical protein